jgi:hypothetical protein
VTDELRDVYGAIETELARSRQTLRELLKQRDRIARAETEPKGESTCDTILAFATLHAPSTFTPKEALEYVRQIVGAHVTHNQVTAWCTKLVKQERLAKHGRGRYALK